MEFSPKDLIDDDSEVYTVKKKKKKKPTLSLSFLSTAIGKKHASFCHVQIILKTYKLSSKLSPLHIQV